MKIVVCIKQVGAVGDEIEFTDDSMAVDPDYLETAINEWDANAIEEALVLQEANGGEVVAVTVGDDECEPVLRRALAMGADRAIRIDSQGSIADPIATARKLAPVVKDEQPDLVLCGVQTSDGTSGATGTALAALLDLPAVAVVKNVELAGDQLIVSRELEGGVIDVCRTTLPATLTIQTGINEPRYATFRAIKQADDKPLDVVMATDVGETARLLSLSVPQVTGQAEMITGSANDAAQRILALVRERVA